MWQENCHVDAVFVIKCVRLTEVIRAPFDLAFDPGNAAGGFGAGGLRWSFGLGDVNDCVHDHTLKLHGNAHIAADFTTTSFARPDHELTHLTGFRRFYRQLPI